MTGKNSAGNLLLFVVEQGRNTVLKYAIFIVLNNLARQFLNCRNHALKFLNVRFYIFKNYSEGVHFSNPEVEQTADATFVVQDVTGNGNCGFK